MGIECSGFPRAATVWRISASSVGAAVKRRGRQRAPARYEVTRTSPMGRGVVPVAAPSASTGTRRVNALERSLIASGRANG